MPEAPRRFHPRGLTPRAARAERTERADERRGSARSRGYGARWEAARLVFLRAHPLCLGCEAMGRVVPAWGVDHVEPHRGDTALFWDEANWQSTCQWHHSTVKQQLEARWVRGDLDPADLRLDSAEAVVLGRRLDPG